MLLISCSKGHTKIVRILLQHGASVDQSDKVGRIDNKFLSVFAMVSLCTLDWLQTGESALHAAYAQGDTDIMRILIQHGASVDQKDIKVSQL